MVRIRLRRMGLKRQPTYRIVVIDQRKARGGKFLEVIGHHNPRTQPSTDVIQDDRALYWLGVGAQPSEAVRRLMERTGTWDRYLRLKGGEALETLLQEAEAAKSEAEPVSSKTRYPSPAPGEGKNAAVPDAIVAETETETEAETDTDAVAEADAEDEVEETEEEETEESDET